MAIDFGSVKSYNSNRGFGFITGRFLNPHRRVFFHIKKIKAKHPEIAEKLDNEENFQGLNLWYEIEHTQKGEQVKECWLHKDEIPENHVSELSDLIQKIENIWKNIDSSKPSWLDIVTIELVGINRKDELSLQRNNLESQRREAEERKRKDAEVERLRQIELQTERERQKVQHQEKNNIGSQKGIRTLDLMRQRLETLREGKQDQEQKMEDEISIKGENEVRRLAQKYDLQEIEANELYKLLEKMRPKNFTHSKQLSKYIVKHKLGYKYPNISGILIMENEYDTWEFPGGFPTRIYAIICEELKLLDQNTRSWPKHFTPFKDILPTDDF